LNFLSRRYFFDSSLFFAEMRGAAATSATHHRSSVAKNNPRRDKEQTIEADSITDHMTDANEKDKIMDPGYNEEEDYLYVFPPPIFRKGDISLGVLMSG
jgi:hypothetical protein